MVNVVLVILDGTVRQTLAADLRAHPLLQLACVTGGPDCIDAALAACVAPVLVLDAALIAFWLGSHSGRLASEHRVVICADNLAAPDVLLAVEHGVQGCLSCDAGAAAWCDALLAVDAGDYWIPRVIMGEALARLGTRLPLEALPPPDSEALTPRQHEIVRWVAEGLSNKAIARRMGISPTTVKTHLQNIFERSGVHGRQQLAAQALRHRRDVTSLPDATLSTMHATRPVFQKGQADAHMRRAVRP